MKKTFLILAVFLLATAVLHARELSLDEAVIRCARDIEGELPQGTMVLVLNFTSPSASFSDYIIEELIGELLQGRKIAVVDRRNLAAIREEMNFQYSGYVSDESMQSIGRMLGAQSVVSGSVTDMGANYR